MIMAIVFIEIIWQWLVEGHMAVCTINISITIIIIIIITFFRSSANGRQRDIWPFAPSIFQLQLRCTHRAAADKHNVFFYITNNRHYFETLERERIQIDLIFYHVMCLVFKLYIVCEESARWPFLLQIFPISLPLPLPLNAICQKSSISSTSFKQTSLNFADNVAKSDADLPLINTS